MSIDVSSVISTATDPASAQPMGDILTALANAAPQAPAVTTDNETATRLTLERGANRRARALAASGIGKADFVLVALPNGIDFYETSFALWKLGAVPTIVSHRLPDAELGAIATLLDPKLMIGVDPIRAGGRAALSADWRPDDDIGADPMPSAVSPHWKAMTSGGSTGRPKIIVDHMPGLWDPTATTIGQIAGDVLLNPGPLYHNAPFTCMHLGLLAGSHVIEMGRFDAKRALELITRHQVGWMNLVPTMMHRILQLPADVRAQHDLASVRVLFHMAAPCPRALKHAWIDWLGPDRIFELYGGTERQGATLISGREWLERPGSVGRVQAGASLRVLRDDGSDCDPGEVGEIYFLPDAGPNATYHYIGAEAKAHGAWESLGDLGYLDQDGYLYLADRRVDLILSGGANIYPAEVEAALESHPAVACAVVIGLPDADLGQIAHAIVELNPGASVTPEALLAHARSRIALYKTPRSVEFVTDRLRDDAGKVRRSALRDARL